MHIREAACYGQLLWYTVLGPRNTQKIKNQKLVLGTYSCQQIGPVYSGIFGIFHVQCTAWERCVATTDKPMPPMLSIWADMAQAQPKTARCFPHQPALSLLPCSLLQKHVFGEKKMNEFLQPGCCGMDILGAAHILGSIYGAPFSNAGVGC